MPRCCSITTSSPLAICNRPATWKGTIEVGGVTPVWCDEHKPQFADTLTGVLRVRRISVVGQMVLTSAVETEPLAKAEALARLARGVQDAGGLLNLHTLTVQTGFWAAPRPPGKANPSGEGN